MFSKTSVAVKPVNRRNVPKKDDPHMNSVVLDLDSTLISSITNDNFKILFPTLRQEQKAKLLKMPRKTLLNGEYVAFQRKHLQAFLDWLFDNFNVMVWSAGSKAYVEDIVNKIILHRPGRKLDYVFSYNHCLISGAIGSKGTKNLQVLWSLNDPRYTPKNTIIVDDTPEVAEDNKQHHYKIREFEIMNPKTWQDDGLYQLTRYLKQFRSKPFK